MTAQVVKLKKRKKSKRKGPVTSIRVDKAFLCECGCGGRVKSTVRYFSREYKRKKMKPKTNLNCRWCGRTIQQDRKYCSSNCEKFDTLRKWN